ncbi:MAG: hypothetical protein ACFFG0_41080, partial [Candidatus Thorarchaeota archaeon]
MSKPIIEYDGIRKSNIEKVEMRKYENQFNITLNAQLSGYDLKPLNSTTGKGSYTIKLGEKTLLVPYKNGERKVVLLLYKLKGLNYLRRAAELRLFKLISEGKNIQGPCCPNANYPKKEQLEEHIKWGYHEQGSCAPKCYINRVFGSLDEPSSINIIPPIIAKPSSDKLPNEMAEYLENNLDDILNMDCAVFHNGTSNIKSEVFNIIDRTKETAINNYMKHSVNGVFPFKLIFHGTVGNEEILMENIGFFIDSLFEVNSGNVKIGSCRNRGTGFTNIDILSFEVD